MFPAQAGTARSGINGSKTPKSRDAVISQLTVDVDSRTFSARRRRIGENSSGFRSQRYGADDSAGVLITFTNALARRPDGQRRLPAAKPTPEIDTEHVFSHRGPRDSYAQSHSSYLDFFRRLREAGLAKLGAVAISGCGLSRMSEM